MTEKTWKHEHNERVARLMDALTRASAALQQAARYAADLAEGLEPTEPVYQTREWALRTVDQLEAHARAARRLLV